ncbi:MAG: hypothetical protein OXN81_07335, partial [Alphaproteobacteria bacterium]|nr:hypothetical protein [Alphaproteobacteria bacterium]
MSACSSPHGRLAGVGLDAVRQDAAAIAAAHRLAGQDNPCAAADVTLALRGYARDDAGREVRQARPLDTEAVMLNLNSTDKKYSITQGV